MQTAVSRTSHASKQWEKVHGSSGPQLRTRRERAMRLYAMWAASAGRVRMAPDIHMTLHMRLLISAVDAPSTAARTALHAVRDVWHPSLKQALLTRRTTTRPIHTVYTSHLSPSTSSLGAGHRATRRCLTVWWSLNRSVLRPAESFQKGTCSPQK